VGVLIKITKRSCRAGNGKIQPWFDEVGGGVQYHFSESIKSLLEQEILKEV